MKNWFNKEEHPSDELVHWSDPSDPTFDHDLNQLRQDWDLLVQSEHHSKALNRLLRKAAAIESLHHAENDAGEDF